MSQSDMERLAQIRAAHEARRQVLEGVSSDAQLVAMLAGAVYAENIFYGWQNQRRAPNNGTAEEPERIQRHFKESVYPGLDINHERTALMGEIITRYNKDPDKHADLKEVALLIENMTDVPSRRWTAGENSSTEFLEKINALTSQPRSGMLKSAASWLKRQFV